MRLFYDPTGDGRSRVRVESDSGKTYYVTYRGSGDGDPEYVALWDCTCPAGQHGKTCKHIHAANGALDYYDSDPPEGAEIGGKDGGR